LPEGEEGIETIIDDAIAQRGRVGVLSFVVFLVTGRRILGGLSKGLNHVSDVNVLDESVKREAAVEIALFVGLVGLALLAFSSDFIVKVLWNAAWKLPGPDAILVEAAQAVLHPLLLFLLFIVIYAFVPRGKRFWRAAAVGAVVSTVLFLLAQGVFAIIFDRLWDNVTLIYGSLAMAALLLSWAC
jgi:membrane protein